MNSGLTRFYRTYEGLKLLFYVSFRPRPAVFIVPMRYRTYEGLKPVPDAPKIKTKSVFIVPMTNFSL
ncbi:hypothetical protein B4113_1662 [Geobacillus sp. B4113_201601]|nr:hypothetical protein B4113_1662 [Geobacillus sp. B4113_201601]